MTDISADDALRQPDGPHRVEWRLSYEEVTGTLICDGADDARCHLRCAKDCGAESWPCYSRDGTEEPHPLRPSKTCNAVEWIDCTGEGLAYHYDDVGESTPVRDGPVLVTFKDDDYMWEYA